ncbi:MAG: DNA-3-methyladenine glycosylase [Kiritimatiellae bacterium]|jgi:DNA-3-methyladenine glycosylase|nr:DNA-3-methyladenine glycosylase [Kiritimatiellia bacterium]
MHSSAILPLNWFCRSTPVCARELLGQHLCRRLPDGTVHRARITETEAYEGFDDRASHAHRGPTPRNEVMFGPPGYTYLYLCYGVHWLLNVTTRERGFPAAILIRGFEGVTGPGRLTRYLELKGSHNRLPLYKKHGLWIESGPAIPDPEVVSGPRVGVDYAGPEWAAKPWRFQWVK